MEEVSHGEKVRIIFTKIIYTIYTIMSKGENIFVR